MRPTFRKLEVKDLGNLEKLVADNIEGIEPGLRIVDSHLLLGQSAIDLVAIDARESLVLVALDFTADEGLLLRGMDACSWCLEYPDTLRRLYPAANVSSMRPPRILFVVERLTDAFVRRIKQLSFLEIDCLEFRHLEVNGASAVYFDLVERFRRAVPGEATDDGESSITAPLWTPKPAVAEPPIAERPWPPTAPPKAVRPAAAPAATVAPAPFVGLGPAPASAGVVPAAPAASAPLETRMAELFAKPSAIEMETGGDATEKVHADAEVVDVKAVTEEAALRFESPDGTARQEQSKAPSVSARVAANPEWQALLSQLGVAMPAPTGKAPAGKAPASDAPTGKAPAGKAPASAAPTGKALPTNAPTVKVESTERVAEVRTEVAMETKAAAVEQAPTTIEPAPATIDAAPATTTPPDATKPSADKVVEPIGGRTYFFSLAAKGASPTDAQAPKPAAPPATPAAPATATASPAQRITGPAQRIPASTQPTVAPAQPRPAAPAQPPAAPAVPTTVPAPQPAAAAAPKVEAAKPAEVVANRPELEALNFPKDGLSRQWLEFLNQLGGAK
jgi:hypothetical protein